VELSFRKEEHLIYRADFEKLLSNGKVYFTYPFRVVWILTNQEQPYPVRVGFAVPKKKYKRANKRNLIKRRMREAFRLNKDILYPFLQKNNCHIYILFIYIGTEIVSYHDMEKKTINVFNHIMEDIQKNS
jgi:ribonuclease P protein component